MHVSRRYDNKFSELHFTLFADGKETNIMRRTRTDGSPRYLKTIDVLLSGDDVFDVLATRGVGMQDWLDAQLLKIRGTSQKPVSE